MGDLKEQLKNWLPLSHAALQSGVPITSLYLAVLRGEVSAIKVGKKVLLVDVKEVQKWWETKKTRRR